MSRIGDKNPNWHGGWTINGGGYMTIKSPHHQRANSRGYVQEHILIAEKLLGKLLPEKAEIHHPFGRANNSIFIICENQSYHGFLEQRTRALKACGHVNWRHCWICKQWDDPKNLHIGKTSACHPNCRSSYNKSYYQEEKHVVPAEI